MSLLDHAVRAAEEILKEDPEEPTTLGWLRGTLEDDPKYNFPSDVVTEAIHDLVGSGRARYTTAKVAMAILGDDACYGGGDAIEWISKPAAAAKAATNVGDQRLEDLVQLVIVHYELKLTNKTMSPEQKRQLIVAYWADVKGLTPAAARDQWVDQGFMPTIRSDSKDKAARSVKQLMEYEKSLVEKLRD
jgi:hypothetical protein